MAKLSAQEFISKLECDASFRAQTGILTSGISWQDFQAKAAAAGYAYSSEEILAVAEAQKSDTLTDEDLDQVAGGVDNPPIKLVAVKTIKWNT